MTRKGFTLIELLVVVLIIGILAAVALPQYEKAVNKARISRWLPFARSLANAMDAYYLANGEFPTSFEQLDIEAAGATDDKGNAYVSGARLYYNVKQGGSNQSVPGVRIRFDLMSEGYMQIQAAFTDDNEMWLNFYPQYYAKDASLKGEILCYGVGSSEKVCRSLSSGQKSGSWYILK